MPSLSTIGQVMEIIGAVLLVAALILALPLTGLALERRRQREIERMRKQAEEKHAWDADRIKLERAAEARRNAERIHESLEDTGLIPVVVDDEDARVPVVTEVRVLPNLDDISMEFFLADPLGSHCLPRELDDNLLIAQDTFDYLYNRLVLTGVGVDVDAEWHEWNERESLGKELVAA